jgi:hypothetical protein
MPGQVVGVRFVGYTQSKRRFPAFVDGGIPSGSGFSIAGQGLASSGGGTTISIANGGVTLAMLAAGAALSVLGVTGNAPAARADIVAGTDNFVLRRSGAAVGFGLLVGASVTDATLSLAKLANGTALSVLGVTGNAGAPYADMAAGVDGHVMRRSGAVIGFGTIAAAAIPNSTITLAKIANGTALSVLGVTGNAGAAYADIVAGTDNFVLRRSGTAVAFGLIVGANVTDGTLSLAKLANQNQTTFVGRVAAGAGVPSALTQAEVETALSNLILKNGTRPFTGTQSSTTVSGVNYNMTQTDTSGSFIEFFGEASATDETSISNLTTGAIDGFLRVNINGIGLRWLAFFRDLS